MAAKQHKRVVGYVRVSRIGGREGDRFLSPELQREQIAAVAAREGLEVVEVIEELDASGGDKRRPGWNRAIELVERGEVGGVAVWNLSRFSRSVVDAQKALDRIEGAGGRLYSATEQLDDSPNGVMVRNILLSIAQGERDRARASFRASQLSALERGIHVAGTIPVGYRRNDATRQLEIDPDKAPIVRGLFERRTKGWGWVRLATWATEQGHPMADRTAAGVIANRVYLGEARAGGEVRRDAHPAIVSPGLFARAQRKGKHSRRSGVLAGRFLLVGIATCAACGRGLRLSQGDHGLPFYTCRGVGCPGRAYARAKALDDFVLNTVEEGLSHGADAATWEAATFAASPGDSREVEDAEAALEEARADLDSFLADTNLRRILGPDKHAEAASNYVAVVNQAAADLAEARERHTGRRALVGHLWLHEWGQAERHEWLERMVRSVVVSRGREPLSRRVEVELR